MKVESKVKRKNIYVCMYRDGIYGIARLAGNQLGIQHCSGYSLENGLAVQGIAVEAVIVIQIYDMMVAL